MWDADSAYLSAFALTWVVETVVYVAAFASLGWFGPTPPRRATVPGALLLVLVVNVASHPLLWSLATAFPSPVAVVLAEFGVVLLEGTVVALVLGRGLRRRLGGQWAWAYAAALLANACSFGIGLLGAALSGGGSAACC